MPRKPEARKTRQKAYLGRVPQVSDGVGVVSVGVLAVLGKGLLLEFK